MIPPGSVLHCLQSPLCSGFLSLCITLSLSIAGARWVPPCWLLDINLRSVEPESSEPSYLHHLFTPSKSPRTSGLCSAPNISLSLRTDEASKHLDRLSKCCSASPAAFPFCSSLYQCCLYPLFIFSWLISHRSMERINPTWNIFQPAGRWLLLKFA